MPRYSIVIPVKAVNAYVRENVPHIQALSRDDWELIILPNEHADDEWNDPRIRLEPTGRVGPAKKRDTGADLAQGDILVFLDDDSYPEPELLGVAERHFSDESVVAIGGPAITPPQDTFWQRVSGAVFLSRFSGGNPERYVPIGDVREVDDWPSVNLMVRRDEFLSIGGFDSAFWPGEDTKLCLDLIEKTGKAILYVPELRVWHHRRAGLFSHLKQVGGYGLHRGFFARILPGNSRKPLFFIPSAFVIFVVLSMILPLLVPQLSWLMLLGWAIYALALVKVWWDLNRFEGALVALAALPYTVLTHLWYGIRFIQGLCTTHLVSKLR